jgi:hypothetical protein
VGNRERIADERVSASVVEPPQEHCDRLTRHPNANEANRRLCLLLDSKVLANCAAKLRSCRNPEIGDQGGTRRRHQRRSLYTGEGVRLTAVTG